MVKADRKGNGILLTAHRPRGITLDIRYRKRKSSSGRVGTGRKGKAHGQERKDDRRQEKKKRLTWDVKKKAQRRCRCTVQGKRRESEKTRRILPFRRHAGTRDKKKNDRGRSPSQKFLTRVRSHQKKNNRERQSFPHLIGKRSTGEDAGKWQTTRPSNSVRHIAKRQANKQT